MVREIGFEIMETQISVFESWSVVALCDRGQASYPPRPPFSQGNNGEILLWLWGGVKERLK